MIERKATIRNEAGIHCRPSAAIVRAVESYPGEILVHGNGGAADCRSVMGLLTLALEKQSVVILRVSGPDEERVCTRLVELFETVYDFPDAGGGG